MARRARWWRLCSAVHTWLLSRSQKEECAPSPSVSSCGGWPESWAKSTPRPDNISSPPRSGWLFQVVRKRLCTQYGLGLTGTRTHRTKSCSSWISRTPSTPSAAFKSFPRSARTSPPWRDGLHGAMERPPPCSLAPPSCNPPVASNKVTRWALCCSLLLCNHWRKDFARAPSAWQPSILMTASLPVTSTLSRRPSPTHRPSVRSWACASTLISARSSKLGSLYWRALNHQVPRYPPPDQQRGEQGSDSLRAAGRSHWRCSFLAKASALLDAIASLEDPQVGLRLLRSALQAFDHKVRSSFSMLTGIHLSKPQWEQAGRAFGHWLGTSVHHPRRPSMLLGICRLHVGEVLPTWPSLQLSPPKCSASGHRRTASLRPSSCRPCDGGCNFDQEPESLHYDARHCQLGPTAPLLFAKLFCGPRLNLGPVLSLQRRLLAKLGWSRRFLSQSFGHVVPPHSCVLCRRRAHCPPPRAPGCSQRKRREDSCSPSTVTIPAASGGGRQTCTYLHTLVHLLPLTWPSRPPRSRKPWEKLRTPVWRPLSA